MITADQTPDPDFETLLKQVALSGGFNAWLDVDLVRAGHGGVEIILPIRDEMLQHHGFVHGGVVGSLADLACSWAASSLAGDVVTQSYTLQLLAPAKGPSLKAVGAVIKASKRSISAQARVYAFGVDGVEKLVATALATIFVIPRSS